MCRDATRRKSGRPLFRQSAVNAVGYRLFGSVAVVAPPSAGLALTVAFLALAGLIGVTSIVEVPRRARAVGVLMPPGGLTDVIANQAGQVGDVFVSDGQLVPKDHLLATVGNGAYLQGESGPEANLRSLRNELELVNDGHASQQEITGDRLIALREQMASATNRLEIAQEMVRSHSAELMVLEGRFRRWQALVRDGHVSRDAFEFEQANLIRERTRHAEMRQANVDSFQTIQTLARSREEIEKQLDLNSIQHALSTERLQREIEIGRRAVVQEFRVSEQSVVVQVLVQPGDAVRIGQVLAKLRQPGERLQAWLYLSTSGARLLKTGQTVEITLDAYPREVYGTLTAVVSSVSGTALLPQDIRAPLLLAGPVFEVIAELDQSSVNAQGMYWPLSPGISFSADIIQERMRLYQWMLKSLLGDTRGG